MKKIILYLLILAQLITITSLSRGEEGRVPYEEMILPMPEGMQLSSMCLEPDGTILALAEDEESNYSFLRWRAFDEMPEVTPLPPLGLQLSSVDIAPDGAILLRADGETPPDDASETMPDSRRNIFVWLDESLQEAESQFEIESDGISYHTAKALPGKRLAFLNGYGGGLTIYDAAGEAILKMDPMGLQQLTSDATTLYAVGTGYVHSWALDSFKKLPTQSMSWRYFNNITLGPEGGLYMSDDAGIYELDLAAGEAVLRMDSMGLSMGDPDMNTSNLYALPDGAFAMLLWEFTKNAEGEQTIQRSIAICQPMKEYVNRTPFIITRMHRFLSPLDKAASLFQRAHPELAVEIRTLNDFQFSGMTNDDALRMINTELLAGGGGDVLVVDSLPLKAMSGRGMLRDISHIVPDLGLLPGIAEASKHTDGKVYAIPAAFGVQLLWGRAEAIESIRTFPDIANVPLGPDQTRLPSFWRDYHMSGYFSACMRDFLDADGKFDPMSEDFIAFLETLYVINSEMDDAPADVGKLYEAEQIALRNGNMALYPETCYSFFRISEYYTIFGKSEARAILMPSMHAPGNAYEPMTLLSIPASAKTPELSEEFIRLVFSAESQNQHNSDSFPTATAKLDQMFAISLERSQDSQYKIIVNEMDGQQYTYYLPEEAFLKDFRAQLDKVAALGALDETILGFILEEIGPFLEGRITAEEAAKAIEQRAWLYMHE